MANKEEDIRKQLEQERTQRRRAEDEQAFLAQQEAARLSQSPQAESQLEETDSLDASHDVAIKPVMSNHSTKDWQKILSAYGQAYPDRPIKDDCLTFTSQDEALTFFREQAKASHVFLVQELVNDKPSGFHYFSCGNGELYSGNLESIQQQLQQVLQENPSQQVQAGLAIIAKYLAPNPAANFRSALNGQREEHAEEMDAAKKASSSPKTN